MKLLRSFVFVIIGGGLLAAGCMSGHREDIPPNALMSSEGNGVISSRAPSDGTVYIYDNTSGEIVYSGAVVRDQLVQINPGADRIIVGADTVRTSGLVDGHTNRIYFTPVTERGRVIERKTVIERVE